MSPIKRLNRVAPFDSDAPQAKSSAMTTLQLEATKETDNGVLESHDTSFIDHRLGSSFAEQVLGKACPKSIPTESKQSDSPSVHLDPVVIIRKKAPEIEGNW